MCLRYLDMTKKKRAVSVTTALLFSPPNYAPQTCFWLDRFQRKCFWCCGAVQVIQSGPTVCGDRVHV